MNLFKSLFLLLSLNVFGYSAYTQNTLELTTNFDLGAGMNSFTKNRDVLTGRTSGNFNSNIGVLFTTGDRYTIELGIGQTAQKFNLRDKDFEDRNDQFVAEVNNKNYHPSYYVALGYTRPVTDRFYTYGKVTFAHNKIEKGSISESLSYEKLNERISATTNYLGSNYSLAPEFGVQLKTYTGFKFHAGVKLNLGLAEILNGSYKVDSTIETTTVNDITTSRIIDIQEDGYSSKGSWLGFNFGMSYALFKSDKKNEELAEDDVVVPILEVNTEKPIVEDTVVTKPVEIEAPKEETVIKDTVTINDDEPKKTPSKPDNKYIPVELEERPVKVTKKYKVTSNVVRVEVFDGSVEDGDTISVLLNGKVIVHEYGLRKKHASFNIYLEEGKNMFSIFAHNLGRIKPNTARVYIWEGKRKHIMTVRSTLGESGAVEINYVPEPKIKEEE